MDLVTTDDTIVRIAQLMNIPFRGPDALKLELLINSTFAGTKAENSKPRNPKDKMMVKRSKK